VIGLVSLVVWLCYWIEGFTVFNGSKTMSAHDYIIAKNSTERFGLIKGIGPSMPSSR